MANDVDATISDVGSIVVVVKHGATSAKPLHALVFISAMMNVTLIGVAKDRVGSAKSRQNVFVHLRRKNDF